MTRLVFHYLARQHPLFARRHFIRDAVRLGDPPSSRPDRKKPLRLRDLAGQNRLSTPIALRTGLATKTQSRRVTFDTLNEELSTVALAAGPRAQRPVSQC